MKIELTILIAIIGCFISVITFFVGQKTSAKKDGQNEGEVLTRLDSIGKKCDKIDGNIENIQNQLGEQRDRITKLEVKVDFYHGGKKE